MQVICDSEMKFMWIDIQWGGSTSDYLAWVTSTLCMDLESNSDKLLCTGMTLVGDNVYVKSKYMSMPLKGAQHGYNDAYNFYLSQVWINIKQAFGSLVHHWAILHSPLQVTIVKVGPLVLSLCQLPNFCINFSAICIPKLPVKNAIYLHENVQKLNKEKNNENVDVDAKSTDHMVTHRVVEIHNNLPMDLTKAGHHTNDVTRQHLQKYKHFEDVIAPMDKMMLHIIEKQLQCPNIICK